MRFLAEFHGLNPLQVFEELFERHRKAAFNLVLTMTGSWDRAEEAVQEAMLKVWREAESFQPREGATVRSWLLTVVAREGLMALRKGRRELNRKPKVERTLKMGAVVEEIGEAFELREALASMRATLRALSESDRQLVALAYGAKMSHEEIARELALPCRAISRRLEEVLNGLRSKLKQAGVAAAVPLVNPSDLCAALLSGHEPQAGLKERILSRLAESGGEMLKTVSMRAAVNVGSSVLLWGGLAIAAVAAGSVWWLAGSKPAAPPTPAAASSESRMGPDAWKAIAKSSSLNCH